VTRSAPHPPCALAELGVVTALGASQGETWPRLIAGDQSRFVQRDDLSPAVARRFGAVTAALPAVPASLLHLDCRNNQLALAAYEQIASGIDAARRRHGAHRIGVVVGTSTSGIASAEDAFGERTCTGHLSESFNLAQLEHGGLPEFVARVAGARGPHYAVATACSAGAKALVSARALLELDLCDAVIAGGVDSLCQMTAQGFSALQAIAKDITNPMSRNRDGLTLGEGAALFLVTRDGDGIHVLGSGESSDAHHMSAPDPAGVGAEACMRAALADAQLAPEAIAYLNLHGTGTPQNDAVESGAVERVFGRELACSSTKPLVGHLLGAGGAVEAAFCWMLLARRDGDAMAVPPHRWDGASDPALAALELAKPGTRVAASRPAAVMSTSFGFGGSNCALVLGDARP
jgi:3-oxoacyl-[acyl-carrier-protein] synthase-1